MISSRKELQFYLAADKFCLKKERKFPRLTDYVWRFQIYLRKVEYYSSNRSNIINYLLMLYYRARKHYLGEKLGFEIPPNVFGAGLRINHFGNIVINPKTKFGMWSDIHQGLNIGTNNSIN